MHKQLLAAAVVAATFSALPARAESKKLIGMSLGYILHQFQPTCSGGKTAVDASFTDEFLTCSTEPPGFTNPMAFSWEFYAFLQWYSSTVVGSAAGVCAAGRTSDGTCASLPAACRCFRVHTVNWTCR